jgi:hypothetical protein
MFNMLNRTNARRKELAVGVQFFRHRDRISSPFLSRRGRSSFISLSERALQIALSSRLAFELPFLFGDEFSEFVGERPEGNRGHCD